MKARKAPKVFFGWWTVLAGGVIAMWASGYYSYGFSALFKPIASELGFSRAVTSLPASIGRLEGGLEAPLTGWLTDKFGPKWIVLFGVFIFSLSLLLMKFVNSLWAFLAVWGIMLGLGHNINSGVPIEKAIANWFVRKRGIAIGIKWVLSGLSGVIALPLIAWLITVQGWRMTCVIGGLIMAAVGLPLGWFFMKRHRPEYYGLLPDGATVQEGLTDPKQVVDQGVRYAADVEESEFTLRQAMRTPSYWLLIAAYTAHALAGPAISLHTIPFLTDLGIDPITAAGMMVIMLGSSIPFRFVGGVLADRLRKNHLRFLMGAAYFVQASGFAVFLLNQSISMIYVWFVLYGFGMGTGYALIAPIRARYFGRKAFGSIQGTAVMITAPVGMIAPVYTGWVYDTSGSYIAAFTVIGAIIAAAAVLSPFILPPNPPAQISDVNRIL